MTAGCTCGSELSEKPVRRVGAEEVRNTPRGVCGCSRRSCGSNLRPRWAWEREEMGRETRRQGLGTSSVPRQVLPDTISLNFLGIFHFTNWRRAVYMS